MILNEILLGIIGCMLINIILCFQPAYGTTQDMPQE